MLHSPNSLAPLANGTNRLLDQLNPRDRNRFMPRFERIAFNVRDPVFEAGTPIEFCWFPLSGMISMTSEMENGSSAEVGIVGKEGFVGVPIVLGSDRAEYKAFVQVAGEGLRISAAGLRAAFTESDSFRAILLRNTNAQLSAVAQCAACNALHSAEERLSRWLLMVRDRIGSETLPITHELLGLMLGTRRSTVTVVAGALERAGLIEQRRGHIRIIDPAHLAKTACECYMRIHRSEQRLKA